MSGLTRDPVRTGVLPARVEDDDALVDRLRAGDEEAFRRLVAEWSPAMLRLARSFVGTAQSAEDVVQDAWLGVLRGLDRFEGRSSLRSWLFTIVVNRARSRGVQDARTVPVSDLGVDGEQGPPAVDPDRFQGPHGRHPGHWTSAGAPRRWDETPERNILTREAIALVEAAMERLPPRQRIVVALRDVHGLDAAEVCRILVISAENQRVLLHRARAALRTVLEDYHHDR